MRAAIFAAIAGAAPIAAAQPAPASATAEAQFDRGRALMKAGKYAEAHAAFEQSQKLEPQWGTLYNLAICSERIGKLASAWTAYRELAARDTKPERRKEARKQIAALEKRLPRLRMVAPTRPPGLVVTLYGADVTGLLGTDNPVDLGTHAIQVRAPGYRPLDTVATVTEEGKTVTVELALTVIGNVPVDDKAPSSALRPSPVSVPGARVLAPDRPVSAAPIDARAKRRRTAIYTAIGGGALAATGLVLGWSAGRKWDSATDLCGADLRCDNDADLATANDRADRARLYGNLSTGLMIGSAAAVGVAAYFWFTAPRERLSAHAVRVAPSAGDDHVGLLLDGSF